MKDINCIFCDQKLICQSTEQYPKGATFYDYHCSCYDKNDSNEIKSSVLCPYFYYSEIARSDGKTVWLYQINIFLRDSIYGFDSHQSSNTTELLIWNTHSDQLVTAACINVLTPLPKNEKEVVAHVERLLNLKAFL